MSRRNNDAMTIDCILDWIEENLEASMSIERVSDRSGYSKWHLQRMFKKEIGYSLGQYIRNRKLTEIARRLKQNDGSIIHLAYLYGFESQQSLTRAFKNFFSVPPHRYRIAHVERAEEMYFLRIPHSMHSIA
ncbi:AraC family DNA-binding protein [Buttiauxella gaviniae ATCC 51604]|jgi:AraC family mar-sox-rob regulon transcriptional activator|uniref:AraC family DNA-binding protein n=1 Tax=Buttiauxella gaviniae ATCC 51604 TaxID=1354253 RepID=A0A1B7HSC1_9ENTR|nr:helix-turn-helix domain-containing protein [Buttiauxella gaviniae]OAT18515.1 AraC family DNA-binding protein [Buttiauxella gaviniae ATCC 51604]